MSTQPIASEATKVTGAADIVAADESPYAVLRWLVAATFIVILNETIMINAIPRLMVEFSVEARTAQWLSTAFMLTMAVVIPVTGWFLQRVTTRTAFKIAMGVFLTGTALAAVAPTFGVLLGARVVQAAGTAVMLPLLMTTLMTIVPEHDRGRVMGNVTLAMSVAPALGPTVSGLVLSVASWRWMFGVVLPVAAVIALVGARRVTDHGEQTSGSIDWASVVLSAAGFGTLVYGLSRLGASDSGALDPRLLTAAGVALVAAFGWRQVALQRVERPLLDLRTLLRPTYAIALALMSVGFMAMIGSMIVLPIFLQDVRGLSALQTGLLVAPGGLAMGLLGPTVGRIYDRAGSRVLVLPGSVGMLVALATFSRVGLETPIPVVLAAHVLLMLSLAAVFTPAFTLGLGALPAHLYSHGSSLLGTAQQVAASIGTAVVIAVLAARSASLSADGLSTAQAGAGGTQWAFGVGAILAVVGLVLALVLPNRLPRSATPSGLGTAQPSEGLSSVS